MLGSLNNPRDLPGLAHFVEHAVYLGDAKYPEENGFSKFLGANGGSDNALTYEDYTTYYFDVAPSALAEALDRFGQLFISPLFRESSLEKEVNAVNSENEKNIPSDSRRIFRVERETANQSHALSMFITGNDYKLPTVESWYERVHDEI
jgi:insulysin